MELRQYWATVTRWWWIILLLPLATGLVTFFISRAITPVYEASATIMVTQREASTTASYSDILASERLARTYRELIRTQPIIEEAANTLNPPLPPEEVRAALKVSSVRDTQLLKIKARHINPALARDIANNVASVFEARTRDTQLENIALLQSALAARGLSSVRDVVAAQVNAIDNVTNVESAALPVSPVSPRVLLNTLLALFAGLMGAVGLAFLLEYLDDTVKSPQDVEKVSLTPLGTVMRWRRSSNGGGALEVQRSPRSSASEAFRILRTGIQFSSVGSQVSSILVTSANPGEGKTTVVANLAWVMANAGKRVIAVDTDLRRPALHKMLHVPNEPGITNMLLAESPVLKDYLQPTEVENLLVLPAGTLPPNPAEILDSRRMSTVMEQLKADADIVLMDSPPLLAVADTLILAAHTDGVMLVVDAGHTRTAALQRAAESLRQAKAFILGGVLNKVSARKAGGYYYYYYYHHYYSDDSRDGDRGWFRWRRRKAAPERKEKSAS